MKGRKYIFSLLTVVMVMILSGCGDKTPKNGDLDGMWQLMAIEKDGAVTSLKDTKHYWSVRANLVQYSSYDNNDGHKFCHFEKKDGKLILTDFCHESGQASSTDNDEWIKYDDRGILVQWGIYAEKDTNHPERLTQTFTIDVLNYDCMILSTDTYKLEFRKF